MTCPAQWRTFAIHDCKRKEGHAGFHLCPCGSACADADLGKYSLSESGRVGDLRYVRYSPPPPA